MTLEAADGDLDIPTQRLDLSRGGPHRDLGRLPDRRRQGDARPARRLLHRRRRGGEHRPARAASIPAACASRRPRRRAKRGGSLSETASGCYTIRLTLPEGRRENADARAGGGDTGGPPGGRRRRRPRCRSAGSATTPRSRSRSPPTASTSTRRPGSAVFTGGVKVGQGTLRLAADRVEVFYADDTGSETGQVERMVATGNVTLSNGAEAAEAEQATYEVAAGTIEMEGDVLLDPGAERAVERAAAPSTSTPAPGSSRGGCRRSSSPASRPMSPRPELRLTEGGLRARGDEPRQELPGPAGAARRLARPAPRRGGGAARPERRRQDHLLLRDRRAGAAGPRHDHRRRRRT